MDVVYDRLFYFMQPHTMSGDMVLGAFVPGQTINPHNLHLIRPMYYNVIHWVKRVKPMAVCSRHLNPHLLWSVRMNVIVRLMYHGSDPANRRLSETIVLVSTTRRMSAGYVAH